MKTLIYINGPNGVGKSTACRLLHERLPRSSWVESEWCRMTNPFDLAPEVELLVEHNMTALLRGYLQCSFVHYVILSYGIHGPRQRILDNVLGSLSDIDFRYLPITLTCSKEEQTRRMAADGRDDARIRRGLETRSVYEAVANATIDTTDFTPEDTVLRILRIVEVLETPAESPLGDVPLSP